MTIKIVRFTNIILVALLAGTSFGLLAGLNPISYSPSTYLEQQQHLVLSLNTLMVSMVIAATLLTSASAFLQRKRKEIFLTLLFAAIFLASCIVISRFGNYPIQKEMLVWKSASMPENWEVFRDKWWSFHIMRTIVELIALILVTVSEVFLRPSKISV